MAAVRVDDVPVPLAPAFHAYGYLVGGALHGVVTLIRRTCRLERAAPAHVDGPVIDCFWHEHMPAYIATFLPGRPQRIYAWMNHPIWFMRPVHVLLALNGVERLALGSTGHGGQAALEKVADFLRDGCSTSLAVDGPAGPPRQLKRGALDLALATGRPLVAIRFEYQRAVRVPGWDRKWLPLPGSAVGAVESAPIFAVHGGAEAARAALLAGLG
jgi:lysophospholipid acyltransferase (LPLAT)-like uncharacterized protein